MSPAIQPLQLVWNANYSSADSMTLLCSVGPGGILTAMKANLYASQSMIIE